MIQPRYYGIMVVRRQFEVEVIVAADAKQLLTRCFEHGVVCEVDVQALVWVEAVAMNEGAGHAS